MIGKVNESNADFIPIGMIIRLQTNGLDLRIFDNEDLNMVAVIEHPFTVRFHGAEDEGICLEIEGFTNTHGRYKKIRFWIE